MNKKNLTGLTFSNVEVIRELGVSPQHKVLWECRCLLCNRVFSVPTGHLTSGHTTSCGCHRIKHNDSHGRHKLYSVWFDIKRRCNYPDNKSYKYYGARGIKMCPEWENDYSAFKKWALENGYEEGLTIDRKDNDKGYSPDNCRWVTRADNNRNKRKKNKETNAVIESAGLTSHKLPRL